MIPVEIMRLPLSSPCPVPVTPEGKTLDDNGDPIPMELRTELCAVDADWMIGAQRCCDIHLRIGMELGGIGADVGGFDGLLEEACAGPYLEHIKEQAARPWGERHRYSQEEAKSWAETAKEHGLA